MLWVPEGGFRGFQREVQEKKDEMIGILFHSRGSKKKSVILPPIPSYLSHVIFKKQRK
jgi:hypothetical protein